MEGRSMASWDQPDGISFSTSAIPFQRKRSASASLESLSSNSTLHSSLRSLDGNSLPVSDTKGPSSNSPQIQNGAPPFRTQLQYHPAQLLNPRSMNHAAPPQSRPMPAFKFNTLSAQNFTFESPYSQTNPYSHPTPPPHQYYGNGNSNGSMSNGFAAYSNGGGMGQMLERTHNVVDRDMVPQKRQKLYDQPRDENRQATFSGGGRGGVLGQYVKEQQEEGRKKNSSTVTSVDLSVDDDEVVVVGDSRDVEVCYGRIEGAYINAHQVPTPKQGAVSLQPNMWPQVKIMLKRREENRKNAIVHAVDITRGTIGCLDVRTSIGLAPLMDQLQFGIRSTARILSRPKRPDDRPPGTAGISEKFNLDLTLYGPKKYAMQVGQHLSQKQLWLRGPLMPEAGRQIFNPHEIQKPAPPPRPSGYSSYSSRPQAPVRTTEEIRSDVLGMFDTLERSENLPEMEPDERITTELLKHQKQGLYFMTNKEKDRVFGSDEKGNSSLWKLNIDVRGQKSYYNVITQQAEHQSPPQVLGGILADMMGLGKTLSILSLVVQTLPESQQWSELPPCIPQQREQPQSKKGKKSPLPVCEMTKLVRNVKTTLLVSPLSTIANWEEQIKQHIKPGTLKFYIYHGAGRIKDVEKLAQYDLVITTYGSIASEFNHRSKKKEGTYPLEEINWFRIVLDEAHMIREQSTQQSKAICRLSAQRRWAVTGTPVQNRLEDLGALMAFLRVKPFDEKGGFAQWIMAPFKICDPEILPKLRLLVDSITLRRLKDRIDLPPRYDKLVRLDFNNEERHVYEIFAQNAKDRVSVIAGQREKQLGGKSYVHILQSILRLRLICAHGKDLLGEEDLKVMSGLSKDSAIDLDSDDEENSQGLSSTKAYDMYRLIKDTGNDICATCSRKIGPSDSIDGDSEPKDEIIGHMTACLHILCNGCVGKFKTEMEEISLGDLEVPCPICQLTISLTLFPLQQGGVEDEQELKNHLKDNKRHVKTLTNYGGPHTKTKALIADLLASRDESEQNPHEPPVKSVVFSGWTSHLDLIQRALEENDITYTRLDGRMTRPARGAALDTFREDPSIHVILVSIAAGGLGLNLTTANKIYVMEPQYNPAAEAQAVDRVHRLGQKRPVTTVRYIMTDSFEEKMLELQEKKKKLANMTLDSEGRGRMDKAEAAHKRLEDLRSLFK